MTQALKTPKISRLFALTFCAALLSALPATSAFALDVGGAQFKDTVSLRGTQLRLNGAGVRHDDSGSLYSAGLYLAQKPGSVADVLAAGGAQQVRMVRVVMLRDISSSEMASLLARSTRDNAGEGEELTSLVPAFFEMGKMLGAQKQLRAGDSFQAEWIPSVGTVISVNGKALGKPIPQPALFDVMLQLWLDRQPAEAAVKPAQPV